MEEHAVHARRVVVTGFGAITPVGLGWPETWSNLLDGRSGVGHLSTVDVADLPVRIGGEVRDFRAEEHLPVPLVHRTARTVHLALAAAELAIRDADLKIDDDLAPRVGVLLGSVGTPTAAVLTANAAFTQRGFKGISPYAFASTGIVSPAAEVALHLGAQGPSAGMATACATGGTCLGEAMRMIQTGRADVMIAGGADDTLTRFDIATAARANALSRRNSDPEAASRPFDRERDGFVMSAGAGLLVLESADHATRRGAGIHGELVGYGASTDAYHLAAPRPDGVAVERAIRTAMAEAGVTAGEVDYVNAHGTSTQLNDATEVAVLRRVFGDHATAVPVSSTKSMTGHMLAAAGAVEAMVMIEACRTGVVPPTINCDDPEDPAMNFVPHKAQEHAVDTAMSNSFGFGGHNVVLVARRWRG
nr:beta-ketoacyl-[acyl-carrier-protein] synthase family protein [Micromonospora sp. DSM 115978]